MMCVFPYRSLNSQPNIGFRSLFSSLKLMGIVGLRRDLFLSLESSGWDVSLSVENGNHIHGHTRCDFRVC